jgi:hypothetical protein
MRATLIFTMLFAATCTFAQSQQLPNKISSQEAIVLADLATDLQRAAIQMLKEQVQSSTTRKEQYPADTQPLEKKNQSKTITQTPSVGAAQSDPTRVNTANINKSESANIRNSARETRTDSGALLRLVDCGGMYQGVAVAPPASLDLQKTTPSKTYSPSEATGGVFPIVREAENFYYKMCPQRQGYAVRPPKTIWIFADGLPKPDGMQDAIKASDRYIWVTSVSFSGATTQESAFGWSVRNGPRDFVAKEDAQRHQNETEQARRAQIAAKQEQSRAERTEFLTRHGAVELQKMSILQTNPFSLEGKIIAIPVQFRQMHSPTAGRFEVLTYTLNDNGGLIIVSDIPKGTFGEPTRAFLAAKVIGLTPLQGFGDVPHLKYVGIILCSGQKSLSSCP